MSDFEARNFDTLEEGYAHLGKENERLRALLAEARTVIAPFAGIEPSFRAGGANMAFTGTDLARARKFMEDSADANHQV